MEERVKYSFTAAETFPIKLFLNPSVVSHVQDGYIPPIHVQLVLTNRCTLNCSFCSCSARDKELELSYDTIDRVMTDFSALGCRAVTITGGGEPTIHPQFDRIVSRLHNELHIDVGLVTNGTILNKVLPSTWSKIVWCRISSDDDRHLTDHYRYILNNGVENGKTVDWAFSHVVTARPSYDIMADIVKFASIRKFTHVRFVSDLLDLQNVPPMSVVRNEMRKRGVDDSLVIYQGRQVYELGTKQCLISLLKPTVSANGLILPCCLDANEIVLIKRGGTPKPVAIRDVVVGDLCWGGDKWDPVVAKFKKPANQAVTISLRGGKSIVVSIDHIMLVADGLRWHIDGERASGRKVVSEVSLVEKKASEVKVGDLIPVVRQVDDFDGKKEWPRFYANIAGYFVAEGWHCKSDFNLMIGKDDKIKEDLFRCLQSVGVTYHINERRTGLQVRLHNRSLPSDLRSVLEDCGTSALTKRVPSSLFEASAGDRVEFLRSLLAGDGHLRCDDRGPISVILATVSRRLASELFWLALSLGMHISTAKNLRAGKSTIEGREVTIRDIYRVSFSGVTSMARLGFRRPIIKHKREVGLDFPKTEKLEFVPVVRVDEAVSNEMYDLQVANSNRFAGGAGILVHNCGTQYSAETPSKDFSSDCSMGAVDKIKDIWKGQTCFDGSKCVRCYYGGYNNALASLMHKVNHINHV